MIARLDAKPLRRGKLAAQVEGTEHGAIAIGAPNRPMISSPTPPPFVPEVVPEVVPLVVPPVVPAWPWAMGTWKLNISPPAVAVLVKMDVELSS